MFDLRTASEGIRKAAAMSGIKSGKWEPVTDTESQGDLATVAKVYNKNFPDGIQIVQGEMENALDYTWKEINA